MEDEILTYDSNEELDYISDVIEEVIDEMRSHLIDLGEIDIVYLPRHRAMTPYIANALKVINGHIIIYNDGTKDSRLQIIGGLEASLCI